jgi:tetratricopeptide (TPR) repeat protein
MCKLPEGMATDPASMDRHVQCLGAVAQFLATECDAPELWNKLCGTPDDNPLLQWEQWYGDLPRRMECLEYDALISEARSFIERAKTLEGHAARQNEAFLQGRLGELFFHSGKMTAAIEPFEKALELCRQINDSEGQLVYLNNLLEVYRYLDDVKAAVSTGAKLVGLYEQHGKEAGHLKKQVERIRDGEPLCRIVCVKDDHEWELDEMSSIAEGQYDFQFRRNRLSLQKSTILVQQGNTLASSGQYADALEKYDEAMEVDPHDPNPVYQSGMCLLELGAYTKAREAFEQVERLAPAWFRCRTDLWLAESLENGTVSDEEFRLLRLLEDGGLSPDEAVRIAEKAVQNYPEFAPFYLALGDCQRDVGETDKAVASYRAGLDCAAEPDVESRLLCALAGRLPEGSPERPALIERALSLNGSLVAQATAKLMGMQ